MAELYTLAIVGAGLSTLSALRAGLSGERTLLVDYQDDFGGFLRAAQSAPGLEDLIQLPTASSLPGELTTRFNTTAVGLLPSFDEGEPHTLVTRQSSGTAAVRASRVLLACGGLELTRESAQIPGPRPAGVMTPVFAHQLLNCGYAPGKQIVVYGSSRYALATAQRLAGAGISVTLISIAGEPHPMLPSAPSSLSLLLPARLVSLAGSPRLEQVTFERMGEPFTLAADALVYAVGMRANTRWLKGSGIALTPQGAVEVDAHYQTSIPGIYAMGTLVSPSLDHVDSLRMGKEVAALLAERSY
jgi:thioredoxin reductase